MDPLPTDVQYSPLHDSMDLHPDVQYSPKSTRRPLTAKQKKELKKREQLAARLKEAAGASLDNVPPILSPEETREQRLANMVKQSLMGLQVTDMEFLVFSRRDRSGTVYKPTAIIASSLMLRDTSKFFRDVLSDTFESPDETESTDKYDYMDDSDLELVDDEESSTVISAPYTEAVSLDDDQSSSSISNDSLTIIKKDPLLEIAPGIQAASIASRDGAFPVARPFRRKVVLIRDIAHNTWLSFMYYLYMGDISFAPLKSQGSQAFVAAQTEHNRELPERPPLCSPKSMYRLANKLGFDTLKDRCQADIRSKISKDNILEELFSRFSSRYSEIAEMEVDLFFSFRLPSDDLHAVPQLMNEVAEGKFPHSGLVLSLLLKKLAATSRNQWGGTEYLHRHPCGILRESR